MRRPIRGWEWAIVAAITAGGAALRLLYLHRVTPDPFYDAAVRSMGNSFHNFFLGAFEPGGSVSIDKPPLDLWLQVASVELLGFNSTTLKLPEALAGTISVPLIFLAVRRLWSPTAGIAAAAGMAVLPTEVITARSDTMDAVMMALLVLALLLLTRAAESGSSAWLIAAAAALGLAFNVKLLESLVALPGLALFAWLGLPGTRRRRLLQFAAAAAVFVAVSLSWLTATLLVPAHERPWAIGSTNGSAWNAAFVFNGTDRLGGKAPEPGGTAFEPGHRYPVATQEERDHIPITPPSATRLLSRIGPLSGERLGLEVLVGLLLGIPALLGALLASRRAAIEREAQPDGQASTRGAGEAGIGAGGDGTALEGPPEDSEATGRERLLRATAVGLIVWMVVGIALFSHMIRLHPRYVEGFTPAVAAMLGIGLGWAAAPGGRWRVGALSGTLVIAVYYSERLLYGHPGELWVALAAALAAIALAALAPRLREGSRARALAAPAGVLAFSLVAVLAIPLKADLTAIHDNVSDAGYVGGLPQSELVPLSAYLRAHQDGARYELAAESATSIGSLIVKDNRPVVVLTTYNARVFTTVAQLRKLIAEGAVRYAFLNTYCSSENPSLNPACSAPAKWVRAHGTDVSRQAGMPHDKTLWLLPGARP